MSSSLRRLFKETDLTFATVTVDVDVDLSNIETDDLIEELEGRGQTDRVPESIDEFDLTEMFYAFKLGREDRAVELARKIAQDFTGAIL